MEFSEHEFMACCGSTTFGQEMRNACPFNTLTDSIEAAREIWFNKVDVNGVLEAFSAHPQIGHSPSSSSSSHPTSAQWSKGEQSTAIATATSSSLQELSEWNARYKEKFGFVFLICASGRSTDEILAELKRRYANRPIAELQIAAEEQMKITELRLAKLFSTKPKPSSTGHEYAVDAAKKAGEERVSIIGGHITTSPAGKKQETVARSRPPITTHVLDVSRGSPGAGIDVRLEMWKGQKRHPVFGEKDHGNWVVLGSSTTDKDGRSGQLMSIVDDVEPGIYRLSFDVGKYYRGELGLGLGFFPHVSIVFEIGESQRSEHFHVPLLLSPFSFTTYRGS